MTSIRSWLTDEQDPQHLRAIAAATATGATCIGALSFFRDFACAEQPGIPWIGIILLVGGLAAIFTDFALYAERAAHNDRVGTWIAIFTMIAAAGLIVFGCLFLLARTCG